jgi:predicted DNA-binding transcriptional regulator AlpA
MELSQCSPESEAQSLKSSNRYDRLTKTLKLFDLLPDTAFIDLKVVSVICDRSPSSIQRDVKEGRLASPIKIGPNAVRWRVGDVRRFLKGVKAEIEKPSASKFSEVS